MKKIVIVILVLSFILVGCKAKTSNASSEALNTPVVSDVSETAEVSEVSEIQESIDIDVFPEMAPDPKNLSSYRNEVVKRANDNDQFLSENESKILEEAGYYLNPHGIWASFTDEAYQETSVCYYPVIYKYKQNLIMWYTDEVGDLMFKTIYGYNMQFSNYGGKVHFDETTDDLIIGRYQGYAMTYNANDGIVSQWQFGEVRLQYKVPVGSIYCGNSRREGYLFRSGTDVYVLTYETDEAVCIAHDVKYVLESNYAYNSDAAFQPLFLMENGDILAYVGFPSLGEEPDSPMRLVPPEIEGGYR